MNKKCICDLLGNKRRWKTYRARMSPQAIEYLEAYGEKLET